MKGFLRKKLKSFGIPYIAFSCIILLVDIILVAIGIFPVRQIVQDMYKTLCFSGIGTHWFLPTIFGAELIMAYAIQKKRQKILALGGYYDNSWHYCD